MINFLNISSNQISAIRFICYDTNQIWMLTSNFTKTNDRFEFFLCYVWIHIFLCASYFVSFDHFIKLIFRNYSIFYTEFKKKRVQDKKQNCAAHTTIITTNNNRNIQTSDAHERTTAYYNGWCAVSQVIGLLRAYTYKSFSTEQVASHLIFDSSFSTITIYNKNVADRNRIVCMREKKRKKI